ncbi:MAG TPA: hypothetical protein VGO93_07670 [Candidatus Xenobia bacterium]|jgi:hypothetical protein
MGVMELLVVLVAIVVIGSRWGESGLGEACRWATPADNSGERGSPCTGSERWFDPYPG